MALFPVGLGKCVVSNKREKITAVDGALRDGPEAGVPWTVSQEPGWSLLSVIFSKLLCLWASVSYCSTRRTGDRESQTQMPGQACDINM